MNAMNAMHTPAEADDLAMHVSLCELRYKTLEKRLDNVETRLAKVETSIDDLKTSVQQGFADIALKIEQENSRRSSQLIITAGSVIVAIIGAVGVWLAHH
jgi:predicted  nucleic acid-binding Zn-ribbon protein